LTMPKTAYWDDEEKEWVGFSLGHRAEAWLWDQMRVRNINKLLNIEDVTEAILSVKKWGKDLGHLSTNMRKNSR
jgi:hypothetical protein